MTSPRRPAGTQTATTVSADLRAYWRSQAIAMAELHICLLHLVPWDKRDLRALPPEIYTQLLPRLDEVVTTACRIESALRKRPAFIAQRVNAALWNFLKHWNQNPDFPGCVPRETNTDSPTQPSLFGDPPP